jgi:hypothetical protein
MAATPAPSMVFPTPSTISLKVTAHATHNRRPNPAPRATPRRTATFGLPAGYGVWTASGLAVVLVVSASSWLGIARCYLALRRRLPWQLMAFLADAHQRARY